MKKDPNKELLKKLYSGEIGLKDLLPKSFVLIIRGGKIVEGKTGKEIPKAVIDRSEIALFLPENGRELWDQE